jgi:hypothetical protein
VIRAALKGAAGSELCAFRNGVQEQALGRRLCSRHHDSHLAERERSAIALATSPEVHYFLLDDGLLK